jgi:hypothetical protein
MQTRLAGHLLALEIAMPSDESSLTFDFFRATPCNMARLPPLANSLQSFETSLFLIGLGKYRSALIACATAWESALKAKLGIAPEEQIKLYELLNRIIAQYGRLQSFNSEKLKHFRTTRNRRCITVSVLETTSLVRCCW